MKTPLNAYTQSGRSAVNRKTLRQIKAVAAIEQRIIKAAEAGNVNEIRRQVQLANDVRRKLNQPPICK